MNLKYCVNEVNKKYLKVTRLPVKEFSELSKICKTIKNVFQKYSLNPLKLTITKIVIDFIQTSINNFCFLQIKYLEATHNLDEIEKKIMLDREKKGLNPLRPKCECVFCDPYYENEIHALVKALKQRRLIFSNHSKYGTNIDKNKCIQDYIQEYSSINGKLFSESHIHILEPLISLA